MARIAAAGLLACAVLPSFAQPVAAEPLESKLLARKVSRGTGGVERFSAADSVRPGDLIEYVASYRNTGSQPLRNVEATLPIPEGTEYVAGSARPEAGKVSADGITYGPQPLLRPVRRDGTEVLEPVPARELRFLRWRVGALEAGQVATYTARVRVRDGQ